MKLMRMITNIENSWYSIEKRIETMSSNLTLNVKYIYT